MFWVHASNAARFEAAYKEIADRFRLPRRDDTTVNVLQLVYNWLCSESSGRWLMILDNADDESLFYTQGQHGQDVASRSALNKLALASFLPQSQNGSILITSRNTNVAVKLTGGHKDIIRIQSMSRDQGLELLQNKLSCPLDEPILELLVALDYMPLAITQAAAYINKRWPRTTVASYTRELNTSNKEREKLLNQAAMDSRRDEQASNSILATLQISFEHLREENPSAADLLSFMSFFNPQGIPDFLLWGYSGSEPNAEDDNDGKGAFEEDLDLLRSYSFATTNLNGHVLQMHRLVQFAVRTWLRSFGHGDNGWRQKFLTTLSQEFPTGGFNTWSKCELLLPHVEPVVSEEPVDTEEARSWAQILRNAAWYMSGQGLYIQAEEMIQGSISARTRILGTKHTDTLDSVSILAAILQHQGKYEEAGKMNRWALEGREKVLGKEHPDTLTSVNNLSLVLWARGKYEEAEQMNRWALEGSKKVLGREHPDTLASVNTLAGVLWLQGKYEEAEQMNRRAVEGLEKVLGKEHPDTIRSVSNLAVVLRDRGKYEEAEKMNRRALEEREKAVGKEHPDTLTSVNNLSLVLRDQGKHEEAEKMNQRALKGREKVLGKEHPDTLASVNNLASVLQDLRKYEEAEQIYRRALEGREKVLGKEHSDTIASVNNLALVLRDQRKYGEAEEMIQQALEGYMKALGKGHPRTLTSVYNLAFVLQDRGKYEEAEQMYRQALEGLEKALGEEHPHTLLSAYGLACLCHQCKSYDAASELYQRVCDAYKRTLGPNHPRTIACCKFFSEMIEEMDKSKRLVSTY